MKDREREPGTGAKNPTSALCEGGVENSETGILAEINGNGAAAEHGTSNLFTVVHEMVVRGSCTKLGT